MTLDCFVSQILLVTKQTLSPIFCCQLIVDGRPFCRGRWGPSAAHFKPQEGRWIMAKRSKPKGLLPQPKARDMIEEFVNDEFLSGQLDMLDVSDEVEYKTLVVRLRYYRQILNIMSQIAKAQNGNVIDMQKLQKSLRTVRKLYDSRSIPIALSKDDMRRVESRFERYYKAWRSLA
ncbi:hypothetical protein ACFL6I_23280 [candidate division KSB1 bacterium]